MYKTTTSSTIAVKQYLHIEPIVFIHKLETWKCLLDTLIALTTDQTDGISKWSLAPQETR